MNYGFPEPGVYKFSDAMGKSITHLTCLAGLTVYTRNLTQNFEFCMQLEQLLDIHQTLVINCSNKICIQLKSILLHQICESILLVKKGPCTCKLRAIRTNSLLQKRMFGFQFDKLNCWSYHLKETLNPAIHTCISLKRIVDFGITKDVVGCKRTDTCMANGPLLQGIKKIKEENFT